MAKTHMLGLERVRLRLPTLSKTKKNMFLSDISKS
jgi:hypothetical protein